MPLELQVKRVYEPPEPSDGLRVLVDRLWPRGMSKEKAQVDRWLKEIGPSPELRKWFGHDPEKFLAFKEKYKEELKNSERQETLQWLRSAASEQKVTLLYAAKDEAYNHARVLEEVLRGEME